MNSSNNFPKQQVSPARQVSEVQPDSTQSGAPNNGGDFDAGKRSLLKAIGWSSVAAGIGGLSTGVLAAETAAGHAAPKAESAGVKQGVHRPELGINIFSSSSVPGESVVFRNSGDQAVTIDGFVPGAIIFGNRVIDLNDLLHGDGQGSGSIEIAPTRIVSFLAYSQPLHQKGSINEYVWVEESQRQISEDAVLVSLGAFLADGKAVVYPYADQPVANKLAMPPLLS